MDGGAAVVAATPTAATVVPPVGDSISADKVAGGGMMVVLSPKPATKRSGSAEACLSLYWSLTIGSPAARQCGRPSSSRRAL